MIEIARFVTELTELCQLGSYALSISLTEEIIIKGMPASQDFSNYTERESVYYGHDIMVMYASAKLCSMSRSLEVILKPYNR